MSKDHHVFEYQSVLDVPASTAYNWHTKPGALAQLTPSWMPLRIEESGEELADDAVVLLNFPFLQWKARICNVESGRQFEDVQESGPFRYWHHRHSFEPKDESSCVLIDHVEYELPFGVERLVGGAVDVALRLMFAERHELTRAALRKASRDSS